FRYNDQTVVQPRVQSRVKLAERTSLLAAGGLYTRPPDNMDENLDRGLHAERAWQTSMGVEQKLAKGVSLTATAYYIDRSDQILAAGARDQGSTDGSGTYRNEGIGRSYGAEALLQARGDRFFGGASYTYGRSAP